MGWQALQQQHRMHPCPHVPRSWSGPWLLQEQVSSCPWPWHTLQHVSAWSVTMLQAAENVETRRDGLGCAKRVCMLDFRRQVTVALPHFVQASSSADVRAFAFALNFWMRCSVCACFLCSFLKCGESCNRGQQSTEQPAKVLMGSSIIESAVSVLPYSFRTQYV